MREILDLDAELKDVNTTIKKNERAIQSAKTTLGLNTLTLKQFIDLPNPDNIDGLIKAKEKEVQRASRTDEIKRAALPDTLPIPTDSQEFRDALEKSIDGVAEDAHQRMRTHIERYHVKPDADATLSHEAWLEAALDFEPDDPCPYCGQELRDRTLIDAYSSFFSDAYKRLAEQVRRSRAILQRHASAEFSDTIWTGLRNFDTSTASWKTLADVDVVSLTSADDAIKRLRETAGAIDKFFEAKQADLVSAYSGDDVDKAFSDWESDRQMLADINDQINVYRATVEAIKKAQDTADLTKLEYQLALLKGSKRRYEADIVADIKELDTAQQRKNAIDKEKRDKRTALTAHTKKVTEGLGATINAYLDRLGAGFRIDYQQPNYRGTEPAAAYNILINNVPVPPRSANDDIARPTFKNTLSAGDKSVLALAIFLATLRTRSDLSEMIVVLDDPFASLDEFRRTFTVNEINKLVSQTAQIIVLSHEKNFLRLIWDTIDQSQMTSISIQTGAPGMASLAPFDLEAATRPRYVTERMEVQEFAELVKGKPGHVRALLRKVLENFYRQGDPDLFSPDEQLGGIIAKLKEATDDHRYKEAIEMLEEINRYTRNFHHAPVDGDVTEDTNVEELKTYCRRVIALTRGTA